MSQSDPGALLKTFIHCLAALIGFMGWLASHGHELWQVLLGAGLIGVAAALVRVAGLTAPARHGRPEA